MKNFISLTDQRENRIWNINMNHVSYYIFEARTLDDFKSEKIHKVKIGFDYNSSCIIELNNEDARSLLDNVETNSTTEKFKYYLYRL